MYIPQASLEKDGNSGNVVVSAKQAEDLKLKEKRKREREVLFSFIIASIGVFYKVIQVPY